MGRLSPVPRGLCAGVTRLSCPGQELVRGLLLENQELIKIEKGNPESPLEALRAGSFTCCPRGGRTLPASSQSLATASCSVLGGAFSPSPRRPPRLPRLSSPWLPPSLRVVICEGPQAEAQRSEGAGVSSGRSLGCVSSGD